MDSRLLNVFHDDPFDGSYTQLNTDFWSSESDTMGQLTETLNGILPIPADAEHDADIYNNAMLATEDNFRIANKIDVTTNFQNKELLIYDDFAQQLPADGGIEIITVDPNSLDSDSEDTNDNNDLSSREDKNIILNYADFEDNQSQYSEATFRTRTDSSSIGDYESHTSDYDDSSDEEGVARDMIHNQLVDINEDKKPDALLLGVDEIPDLSVGLLAADGIDLDTGFQLPLEDIAAGNKNRTMSTNTIGSDVDVNNFDLAEFITNDDLALTVPKVNTQIINNVTQTVTAVPTKRLAAIPVKTNIDSDSDAESDVIVDIETVDVDMDKSLWKMATGSAVATEENVVNDITYEDNVKKDPSWSPNPTKKQENMPKETKARPTTTAIATSQAPNNAQNTRNFTIVPNKRQCDILKGKSGAIRNKSTSKQSVGKSAAKKGSEASTGNTSKAGSLTCRVGVGQGGKNLDLLSHTFSANDSKPTENKTTETIVEKAKVIQPTVQEKQVTPKVCEKVEAVERTKLSVKRKLNLEEYKRRRGDKNISRQTESNTMSIETDVANAASASSIQVKHSQEVTTVVKTLRNQNNQKPLIDPITEAKNKVLRMQELKRAQQLKIIDSTISAKVPRVTKLPPLKDIVKDTYCCGKDRHKQTSTGSKLHPDYEEVIIVSVGNNTDISIPPLNMLPINTCERSLLKSSALLYSMSNGLPSSSSLIASIQDVVVQKVVGPEKSNLRNGVTTPVSQKTQKGAEQHGEDKVIMHLRKDRIRPRMVTMGIQTDPQPGFTCLPPISRKPRAERSYRKHSGGKAIGDDTDSDASCDRTYNRHRNRSRSPINRSRSRSMESLASSTERSVNTRQSDMAGGYSSRSSRRHRSSISSSYSESGRMSRNTQRQPRTSYKKRTKKYARNSSASSSQSSSDRSDRSRNRNRNRSRSPFYRRSYSRSRSRSRSISVASNRFRKPGGNKNFPGNNVSQPAVEERRIVYVGRIEEETTKEMLRRKFLPYGTIKQISIHYKDTGMKYGFVTYERSQDAFTVIDSSARDSTINMYDISFGGRRAFCRSSYADLDNAGINTYHSIVFPKVEAPPKEEDSFEALLQKVKAKMSANKGSGGGANANKA
uniref:Peroxisome proliferator-activated receptor gamma coactivator-related protein 1 n=2 Tax=Bactrocera latifrons TaxID=174628 RepID=A0A0K8VKM8_BACLA